MLDFVLDRLDAIKKYPRMWAHGLEHLELGILLLIEMEAYILKGWTDREVLDAWRRESKKFRDTGARPLYTAKGITHEEIVKYMSVFREELFKDEYSRGSDGTL